MFEVEVIVAEEKVEEEAGGEEEKGVEGKEKELAAVGAATAAAVCAHQDLLFLHLASP